MAVAVRREQCVTVDALIGVPWDRYVWELLEADRVAELEWLRQVCSERDCRSGIKAMRLAPCLEVYEALLRGQDVPVDRLEPEWRRRYGL